jgi:hypothetical protein
VVRGAKPGPVLALVSGAHGTEYASIIALEKVIQSLDAAQVAGTVVILPLVNIASFEQKVPHVNPVDGKSMNRFYPGKQDGTQTERASYLITKQVVERCDYLVDYHGGDLDENLRPYAYWPKSGDAKHDAITRDMVLAFGLGVWLLAGQKRGLRIIAGSLVTYAVIGFMGGVVFPMHSRGTQEGITFTDLMQRKILPTCCAMSSSVGAGASGALSRLMRFVAKAFPNRRLGYVINGIIPGLT